MGTHTYIFRKWTVYFVVFGEQVFLFHKYFWGAILFRFVLFILHFSVVLSCIVEVSHLFMHEHNGVASISSFRKYIYNRRPRLIFSFNVAVANNSWKHRTTNKTRVSNSVHQVPSTIAWEKYICMLHTVRKIYSMHHYSNTNAQN